MRILPFGRREHLRKEINGGKLFVRTFRRSDREAILQITANVFAKVSLDGIIEQHFGRISGTGWSQRKCDGIDIDLNYHGRTTFVAELDDKVVGFVATRLYRRYSIGHVANLAVDTNCQSKGIGRELMNYALAFFEEAGMSYARIETMTNNEKGMRLYPSLGFKEIGRQVFYFKEL